MREQQKVKNRGTYLLVSFLFLTTFLTYRTFKKVNVKDITVIGSELFSKDDVVKNSSINFPTRLIFIKTEYTEKELRENLSLENVSVIRQILPFGLKIFIKTRTPIAYAEKILQGQKISGFVDKNGFFIYEKYADKRNIKKLSLEVLGWKENFKNTLSKIFNSPNYDEIELIKINFMPNGFLILEERNLKKIFLGFNPKIIETQLQIIKNIKSQLKENNILKKIDNIDLSDPSNPKIKVFKP